MVRVRVFAVLGVLLVLAPWTTLSAANYNEEEYGGLLHRIETDSYQYELGDSVQISYSVTNPGDETVYFHVYVVSWPLWTRVLSPGDSLEIWVNPAAYYPMDGWVTLPSGESLLTQPTWDMVNAYTGQPITQLGVYTVEGELYATDPAFRFAVGVPIQVVEPQTGIHEPQDSVPTTWGAVKALCRH